MGCITICFDEKGIDIDYSAMINKKEITHHPEQFKFVKVTSSERGMVRTGDSYSKEDYQKIEEIAQMYLINEGLKRAHGRSLLGIFKVRQDVLPDPCIEDHHISLEIQLQGVAVYRAN